MPMAEGGEALLIPRVSQSIPGKQRAVEQGVGQERTTCTRRRCVCQSTARVGCGRTRLRDRVAARKRARAHCSSGQRAKTPGPQCVAEIAAEGRRGCGKAARQYKERRAECGSCGKNAEKGAVYGRRCSGAAAQAALLQCPFWPCSRCGVLEIGRSGGSESHPHHHFAANPTGRVCRQRRRLWRASWSLTGAERSPEMLLPPTELPTASSQCGRCRKASGAGPSVRWIAHTGVVMAAERWSTAVVGSLQGKSGAV
ncbi:hypothetical protein K458DRAFT_31550 [Lentithecium fluviatile CBS 122367]|uniref:Uncharacterized protein n=1 Tax=Lentithecium fluviatile CBS 122367 TaxID=1168545 RepID=A0A6G1J2P0_9PLEO|nr:hypothetical protein K458DRAFT_31550 [Lentithecium fluviatile CBS 122367]